MIQKDKINLSPSSESSEKNILQAIELFPTSVYILDERGIIIEVNSPALELTGGTRKKVIQTSFINLIKENQRSDFQIFLNKSFKTADTQKAEFMIMGKDNNHFPTLAFAKQVVDVEPEKKLCSVNLVDFSLYKMQEELIRENQIRFENMANTAPVMIWIADVDGLFSFLNKVWLDFTGNEMGDDLGMNWLKNVHPEDLEKLLGHYQDAFRSKTAFSYEFRFRRNDDVYRWIMINGTPRFSRTGIFMGFIGSCSDISEQKESEAKIQNINIELAEINATKDKFFSIISHDLRSPLSGLMQILFIIAEDYDSLPNEEKLQMITDVANSSKKTYELMENLLEWSSIQTGTIPFYPQKLTLLSLINNLEELYTQNLKSKKITLNINVDPEISVFADKKMAETILRNLISNAIKFTYPNGTVSVSSEPGNDFVVTKVIDTGVGIKAEKISELFMVDKVQSTPGTAKETGTGLGLILCKELVEKQNGKMWVESKENEGTTFYFTLPVKK
jgi:two-component system sensor histidine kinase/response regulator